MSEIRREDFFSDDLIQAPLVLASNMEKVLQVARQITDEMGKLATEVKGAKSITDLNTATQQLNATQKDFEKLQQQLQQAQLRTTEEYIKQSDEVARLKEEQKRAADMAKLNRQINEQQEGSIKKLELQLKKNRLAYEQMSKAERENTDAGRALLKTIQEQDAEYKKLKQSIGQSQANVGNYKQAIIEALAPMRGLSGGLGNLASGFTGNIGAINSFSMAMKSIPIFAIIGAITSLLSYFTKTEDGAMKLKIVMSAVATVFDTLLDYVIGLGRAMSTMTWDSFKEGLRDIGDSIKSYVIDRVQILIRGIRGIGEAFELLFKGEFRQAAKTAGNAFTDIIRTATPLGLVIDAGVTAAERLGEVAKKVYDDISDRVQRSIDVQKRENALLLEKRRFLITEAELNVAIAEGREKAADATLSDVDKLKELEKVEENIRKLYAERVRLKEEENRIAQIRDDLAENDIAANDAAAQRVAELIQLRADEAREVKNVSKQISALRKKIDEEERLSKIRAIKEVNEAALAELQARLDHEVKMIQDAALRGEITRQQGEERINDTKKRMTAEFIATQIEGMKQLLGFEELTAEERAEVQKKLNDLQRQYNDALFQQLKDQPEEVKKSWKETFEEVASIATDAVSRISSLFLSASERRIAALDAEIAKIDENAKRELALAGENEEAKRIINERAERDREKIEAKRRQERQRAARIEKAAAIIDATIATAVAVAKALPNIPLSLIIAALGAAQIATIARQPIPQFEKGTAYAPGGLAIVGEKGAELVRERSGRSYLTPSVPTLMNIPRGAEILPHDKTIASLATLPVLEKRDHIREELIQLRQAIIESDNRIVNAIFKASPDIVKHGSIIYLAKRDAEGNRQLIRKTLFG